MMMAMDAVIPQFHYAMSVLLFTAHLVCYHDNHCVQNRKSTYLKRGDFMLNGPKDCHLIDERVEALRSCEVRERGTNGGYVNYIPTYRVSNNLISATLWETLVK